MSVKGERAPRGGPAAATQVRAWVEDVRTVLGELALLPRRQPGLRGAVADSADALHGVLFEIEGLRRLDTDAAVSAASAAHSAAQILLQLATGGGDIAEPNDSAWWLGHAGWLIGRAHVFATEAHAHGRKSGRPAASGDTKSAFIVAERQANPGLKDAEIAHRLRAHDVDVGQVGKVRRRMQAKRLK